MRSPVVALVTAVMFAAMLPLSAFAGEGLSVVVESVPALLESLTIAFTDWAAIKAEVGTPGLTSDAPLDDRTAFARHVDADHAAGSTFALSRLSVHAEAWGFDTTDLEWEAQITAHGTPSTFILKLRDDFDMSVFVGRLDERGFARIQSYGEAIYWRAIDPVLAWVRTTELAIHNTAVLAAERLLILSSAYSMVELLLATRASGFPRLSENPSVATLVGQFESAFGAYLLIGSSTCLRFTPNPLLDLIGTSLGEAALDSLRAWLDSGEPLYGYAGLAVGYRHERGEPIGTIAFVYPNAADAAHDFEARVLLAESGGSAHYEAPVSESYFTLEGASIDGRMILLTVRPVNGQPRRLFQMLIYADAPFAGCR